MNDVAGGQAIAGCDFGVAGRATAELTAVGKKFGSGGTMDRTVHTASAKKRWIGGVYDRIERQRRDVRDDDLEDCCSASQRPALATPCLTAATAQDYALAGCLHGMFLLVR